MDFETLAHGIHFVIKFAMHLKETNLKQFQAFLKSNKMKNFSSSNFNLEFVDLAHE